MQRSRLGRSLRLSVAEGGLATAMGSLFSGVFLIGFALALGATRLQIGILFTLPSLCAFAQLLGSYWIERGGNCRRICLQTTAIARLLYIPLLVVPLLARGVSPQTRVWWIIGIMAVSDFFASLSGVAWLTWIKAMVPGRLRVPFFGRRNLVNTGLAFGVCLVCGAMVDQVNRITGGQTTGFLLVFLLAMCCGLTGLALLTRIPDAEPPEADDRDEPFLQSLLAPLRETNFRRVTSFYVAWNMAVSLAAPFVPVFFLQKLGLPIWYIVVLNTLSNMAGMAANNFWTRLAQRFGVKPIVLLATLGDALLPLMLIFVDVRWAWVLLPIHLSGVFSAPVAIGPDSFLLKLTPDRNASSYMAVFRTAVGLAMALAAALGGLLAESWMSVSMAGGLLTGLKLVFLISFVGRVGSLVLLAGVNERGASTVREVFQSLAKRRQSIKPRPAVMPRNVATEPAFPAQSTVAALYQASQALSEVQNAIAPYAAQSPVD
ncbi:MAG: MFS transporter [Planctomycetaceae bacterium]|nr:MFS transporter [Planctomycetaceae bacterium]